jgi:hypothetical protein
MNPPAPPPPPPGKPSLEQIVAQIEAAIGGGQLERARQQLTWAWQVYGGVPALQNLAARLLAPPEAGPPRTSVSPELPTVALPPPPPPRTQISADLPTQQLPTIKMPLAELPTAELPTAPLPDSLMPTLKMPVMPMAAPPEPPPPPPPPAGPPPAQIEAWIAEAQQLTRAANYDGALDLLGRALQVAPQDESLQRHHQLTDKAAQRHRAAVEREQEVVQDRRRIETLLQQGELVDARQALREAVLEHGRHSSFEELQARLDELFQVQKKAEADELLGDARFAYQNGEWQQAVAAAEAYLSVAQDPQAEGAAEAAELRQKAQLHLTQIGREKIQREAFEAAVRDVERLLGGRELQQAAARLAQAIQRLGHHPSFEQLQKRIDAAKSEQQFQLRNDWAERRARELESLIQDSVRASMANDFQRSVEKLEAAKKLEPEHPELESKLEVARGLLEKQKAEQRKAADLNGLLEDLRAHLDALALDKAELLLQRASGRYPEAADRFAPLRQRLALLREAESAAILPTPEDLSKLNRHTEAALADRQRALAAAYSFGQALLYPLRGAGPAFLAIIGGLLLAVDAAAVYLPLLGPLRSGLPLPFFFFTLPLLTATLEGGNQPRWADLKMTGRDFLVGFLGVVITSVLTLPLLLFVAIRGNHHLIDAGSGPFGFLLLAVLAWISFPPLPPLLGITAAFGPRHLLRIGRHFRFMAADGGLPWKVATLGFGLFLLAFLSRLALGPLVPWLGLPLSAFLTAYALIGLPHWIGVAVRRRRIELARLYS